MISATANFPLTTADRAKEFLPTVVECAAEAHRLLRSGLFLPDFRKAGHQLTPKLSPRGDSCVKPAVPTSVDGTRREGSAGASSHIDQGAQPMRATMKKCLLMVT